MAKRKRAHGKPKQKDVKVHVVQREFIGPHANQPRLQCLRPACHGEMLVSDPSMPGHDWQVMRDDFFKRHPCSPRDIKDVVPKQEKGGMRAD